MNQPDGTIPLPQSTLPTSFTLQQNPQSNLRPQLPAQPNLNPNNRPVQSVQIIKTSELEIDVRECKNLQLMSGCIIETERDKNAQVENQLPVEKLLQEEDVVRQQNHDQSTMSSPTFPEQLIIPRPIEDPDFDLLEELRNLCIKIRLLQAMQDIPYAKTIKELCIRKPMRRIKTNTAVQVVGTLSDLLSRREPPVKYEDPGNPIVMVQINGQTFSNFQVDLGATINILTTTTCQKLGTPTSTLLEIIVRLVVKPKGTLHDIMVSVDSWEYHADFLIINPKNRLDGHPLILGRTWLPTADAYIGCRKRNMTITRGSNIKNLAVYSLAHQSLTIMKTNKKPLSYLT